MGRPRSRPLSIAFAVSFALLGLRLAAAQRVGFADAEALYVSYALHPQPAYLEHPGLIGTLVRWLAQGATLTPTSAHVFTAFAATVIPWIGALAARAAGAAWKDAARVVIALALLPELALQLSGMTPELLLSASWLGALGAAVLAARAEPRSFRALWTTLLVGVLVGLSCLSKLSGGFLALGLLTASLTPGLRGRWKTPAPWAACAVIAVLVAPVVLWEVQQGAPMLMHQLQTPGSGEVFANLGALIGQQVLYVTPPFLVGAYVCLQHLWRQPGGVDAILKWTAAIPFAGLILMNLWSRSPGAEWLAPAYFALAIHWGRDPETGPVLAIGRRTKIASAAAGAAVILLVWTVITTPLLIQVTGGSYPARYDPSNELHAWGPGRRLLDDAVDQAILQTHRLPTVVGPHWSVCAQAQAAVQRRVPVGCHDRERSDFDRWLPPERWLEAPILLYITDSRFERDPALEFPNRRVTATSRTAVRRGGITTRVIRVVRLELDRATAQR